MSGHKKCKWIKYNLRCTAAREILHRVVTNESKDATIHVIQQLFDSPSAATPWSVPQFAVEEF